MISEEGNQQEETFDEWQQIKTKASKKKQTQKLHQNSQNKNEKKFRKGSNRNFDSKNYKSNKPGELKTSINGHTKKNENKPTVVQHTPNPQSLTQEAWNTTSNFSQIEEQETQKPIQMSLEGIQINDSPVFSDTTQEEPDQTKVPEILEQSESMAKSIQPKLSNTTTYPKSWSDLFPQANVSVKQPSPNQPKKTKALENLQQTLHSFKNEFISKQNFGVGDLDIELRGLYNPHNKCFLNVILQVLIHSKPFYDFLQYIQHLELPENFSVLKKCIKFQSEFSSSCERANLIGKSFKPDYFYQLLTLFFPNHESVHIYQEDAQEFLSFVLDQMHEELLTVLKHDKESNKHTQIPEKEEEKEDDEWIEVGKKNKTSIIITKEDTFLDSPISFIFGGKLRSSLKKYQARDASVSIQPFFCIHLDIKHPQVNTLEEAISWFCSPEIIEGVKDSSSKEVRASKSAQFDRLPPILIFHLKRFSFLEGTQKILKPIQYSLNLTIPSSLTTFHIPSSHRNYKLLGVVYHLGKNAANGHYTCSIRTKKGWLYFDDHIIQFIKFENVFNDPNAYLLIYQRFIV